MGALISLSAPDVLVIDGKAVQYTKILTGKEVDRKEAVRSLMRTVQSSALLRGRSPTLELASRW